MWRLDQERHFLVGSLGTFLRPASGGAYVRQLAGSDELLASGLAGRCGTRRRPVYAPLDLPTTLHQVETYRSSGQKEADRPPPPLAKPHRLLKPSGVGQVCPPAALTHRRRG